MDVAAVCLVRGKTNESLTVFNTLLTECTTLFCYMPKWPHSYFGIPLVRVRMFPSFGIAGEGQETEILIGRSK